jgi:ketosteroid isomerase-like protein
MTMRQMMLLALLLPLVSHPAAAQSVAQMQALNDQVTAAFAKNDAAAVCAAYGEDAVVLPDRGETVAGAGLQRFWQAVVARMGDWQRETLSVEPLGPGFAREVGRFSFKNRRDLTETSGKYVVVWAERNGAWKRITDIWNRDR